MLIRAIPVISLFIAPTRASQSQSQIPISSSIPSILSTLSCLTTHRIPFSSPLTNSFSSLFTSPNSTWTFLSTPYNLRLPWIPAVIVLPESVEQVGGAIKCAAEGGLKVQARSGGHSYAGFSSGGRDGGMVVDLRFFNGIVVDENGIATVGPGARLGNLVMSLYRKGKRALPHGVCPGVGVGGHFTHGGYGYQARSWGLALDSIVALDIVLANGTSIHTNDTQHSDIFFAMRGAADSFGIVTQFYLQTHSAPENIVVFTARIPAVLEDPEVAAEAFLRLQKIVVDPEYFSANLSFSVYINEKGSFTLRGWCIECDATRFEDVTFSKLLEGFPTPSSKDVTTMGWVESMTRLSDGVPIELPLYSYDDHDTFYSKSILTKISKPLTRAQWYSLFSFIHQHGKTAPSPWNTIIDIYGGVGSQINTPSTSSFSHRSSLWVIQNNANTRNHKPPLLDSIKTFITDLTDALPEEEGDEFGIYLNCADPELSAAEVARRGYGRETYNRLLGIKMMVDPGDVFWNPQTVGNVGFLPDGDEDLKLEL